VIRCGNNFKRAYIFLPSFPVKDSYFALAEQAEELQRPSSAIIISRTLITKNTSRRSMVIG
jgi:hypothetical protein